MIFLLIDFSYFLIISVEVRRGKFTKTVIDNRDNIENLSNSIPGSLLINKIFCLVTNAGPLIRNWCYKHSEKKNKYGTYLENSSSLEKAAQVMARVMFQKLCKNIFNKL